LVNAWTGGTAVTGVAQFTAGFAKADCVAIVPSAGNVMLSHLSAVNRCVALYSQICCLPVAYSIGV